MNTSLTMREMPEAERPYEKCLAFGPEYLTDAELLAILLRTGTRGTNSLELANRVLRHCPSEGGITGLFHVSRRQLENLPGIGKVKAMQLKCICEISRRISRRTAEKKLNATNPASVAAYYMETLRHAEQEKVYCMMLDSKCHYMGDVCLSQGTVNAALISPRELFLQALEYHAVSVVLIHNHPSGDPLPSREDIDTTRRVADAGDLIGIPLIDHIIIGNNSYFSMTESGMQDSENHMEHGTDVFSAGVRD